MSSAVLRRKIKHRTVPHVLTTWLTAALFFGLVWDYRNWGFAFALGGLCHWLQDSLTVTGVPVLWWSDRRTTLLGGRMSSGGIGEYLVSAAVVAICAGIIFMRGPESGFLPFFRNWPELYRARAGRWGRMAGSSVRVVLTVHFDFPGKLAIAAFLLFPSYSASAETLTGRIVAIADGDTVTLLDASKQQHKIRLSGIDAPERKQAFGNVSRQHLAGFVFGKQVTAECPKTDRYGRLICTIEVDGIDANLAQIAAGMAWHYKTYQRDQRPDDRARYALAEEWAQQEKRGLWVDRSPVAPWEFRKARRN